MSLLSPVSENPATHIVISANPKSGFVVFSMVFRVLKAS
jgi:hypothetical protein